MEELIHFTNFTSYYGHIHLMSLHFDAFNAEINLIIDINLDDLNYTWEIKAEQVLDFKNLTQCSLNPFFRIKEYKEHSIIKGYADELVSIQLNENPEQNPILLSKIHHFLKKETGLWMDLNQLNQRYLFIPESIFSKFKQFCKTDQINYQIEDIQKPIASNLKLLIFGNELVSSDFYNFKQPYILAKNFSAKRID